MNWETPKVFSSGLWSPLYFIWFPGGGEKKQSSFLSFFSQMLLDSLEPRGMLVQAK